MSYPVPENEQQRLNSLTSYQILDTLEEQEYNDIVSLLANICGTPIATIALLDSERKWHKAKYGIDKDYVPREDAICAYTILQSEPLIVNDTIEHAIFRNIGMVTKPPHVRFYAGIALTNKDGYNLGTLCTIDTKPKKLTDFQIAALAALGRQVVTLLELRKSVSELKAQQLELSQQKQLLAQANHKLTTISHTDELSGLFNRRALAQHLLNCQQKNSLAILMIDIDHFKSLNDNYGHQIGDVAIQKLSELLQQQTRHTDPCIRYGGDEFIVLVPEVKRERAQQLAEQIRQAVTQIETLPANISASIGIAYSDNCQRCHQALLKLADSALYQAKQQGRNQVTMLELGEDYSPSNDNSVDAKSGLA